MVSDDFKVPDTPPRAWRVVVIAVVDEGGNLMAVERVDGTFAAGASIS
jgi:uncharacterized protein GlcG (DUF336 family)